MATRRDTRFKCNFQNVIYDVLSSRFWTEAGDNEEWDIQWAERDWTFHLFDHGHFLPHQRVNHFRNSREMCRKDLLCKNLRRRKRQIERQARSSESNNSTNSRRSNAPPAVVVSRQASLDFFPSTFCLPDEYALFVEEFKRSGGGTWIMKPIGSSQGKGIFFVDRLSDLSDWKPSEMKRNKSLSDDDLIEESYIIQRYLVSPYLIGKKKFDIRLYALVTSFNSTHLSAFIYRQGFCRFSSMSYDLSCDGNGDDGRVMHLTNNAIQKKHAKYQISTGGCKINLTLLLSILATRCGWDKAISVLKAVQQVVYYTIISIQPQIISDVHCFELYGFDILIDEDLNPWLLEVNASPSLSASTLDDYHLKFNMLHQVMNIVINNDTGDTGFDRLDANECHLGQPLPDCGFGPIPDNEIENVDGMGLIWTRNPNR